MPAGFGHRLERGAGAPVSPEVRAVPPSSRPQPPFRTRSASCAVPVVVRRRHVPWRPPVMQPHCGQVPRQAPGAPLAPLPGSRPPHACRGGRRAVSRYPLRTHSVRGPSASGLPRIAARNRFPASDPWAGLPRRMRPAGRHGAHDGTVPSAPRSPSPVPAVRRRRGDAPPRAVLSGATRKTAGTTRIDGFSVHRSGDNSTGVATGHRLYLGALGPTGAPRPVHDSEAGFDTGEPRPAAGGSGRSDRRRGHRSCPTAFGTRPAQPVAGPAHRQSRDLTLGVGERPVRPPREEAAHPRFRHRGEGGFHTDTVAGRHMPAPPTPGSTRHPDSTTRGRVSPKPYLSGNPTGANCRGP